MATEANETGAEIYKTASPSADKFLSPDGSIKTLSEIIGTSIAGTLDTNNATAQAVPETPESFATNIDLHKISKTGSFADLLSTPTTLSGYGITDGATTTYADGKVEDSITDGHTTIAPSGNAVFDALALKLDKTSTGTTRRVYGVDATDAQELTEIETAPTDASTKLVTSGGIKTAIDGKLDVTSSGDLRRVYGVNASNAQELTEIETAPTDSSTKLVTSGGVKSALDAKVEDAITDGHTTIAPSGNAVYDALALKAPLASPAFTGIPTGIRQDFTATLPYTSWTGSSAPYTKEVTVVGILSTDKPDINLDLSSSAYSDVATIQSDWANVYRGVTSADTITFYASTVPTIDIPLQIKVVR